MSPIELLADACSAGIKLGIVGDRISCRLPRPSSRQHAALLEKIRKHRDSVLELLVCFRLFTRLEDPNADPSVPGVTTLDVLRIFPGSRIVGRAGQCLSCADCATKKTTPAWRRHGKISERVWPDRRELFCQHCGRGYQENQEGQNRCVTPALR